MRFYTWCKGVGSDPLKFTDRTIQQHVAWMERKPYVKRSVRASKNTLIEYRAFLHEVPHEA